MSKVKVIHDQTKHGRKQKGKHVDGRISGRTEDQRGDLVTQHIDWIAEKEDGKAYK